MNVDILCPPQPVRCGRVIALHCSGAGAAQWRHLSEALGGSWDLTAPEHYGCASAGPWSGERAFTLADEAARTLSLIDKAESKVHLVGHSYGGGGALHAALARPDQIASMALYEPSAFHLLARMGSVGAEGTVEIDNLIRHVNQGIVAGDLRGAAARFVDYWNGEGAWEALRPAAQASLIRWAPKAPLDFHALLREPDRTALYEDLRFPVLLLCGENARTPSRMIAEHLARAMPETSLVTVPGAGHMGPFTHASEVSALIAQHLRAAERSAPRKKPARQPCAAADILQFSRPLSEEVS
jgi:pimeloyl-ACP methyl ester carboxylesterase